MKKALLAMFVILATSSAYANHKTTTLKFPKGSYCTSFTGYYHNRVFNIHLAKGQTLEVNPNDVVDGVMVKDPKGKILPNMANVNFKYKIQQKGNHIIKINRASINGGSDTIEFCAY